VLDAQGACETLYREAIELARKQGALSFELRAATSLARLKHRQGQTKQAKALLLSVYEQFTEGFASSDLKEARALLDSLPTTSP
jgi:predicted ATPase